MRVQVETKSYYGSGEIDNKTGSSLVSSVSALLVDQNKVMIVIDTDENLTYTEHAGSEIVFAFNEDHPWDGYTVTRVCVTAEEEIEVAAIRGMRFTQAEKGQVSFLMVPFALFDNEKELTTWRSE
jgi:hypothetical protein